MRLRRRSRRGFTLLEVIMALAIAVLLLGALYFAVDLQIRATQNSRDTIQGSNLERALMARMDTDAAQVIGLSDPARYRFQAGLDTVDAAAPTAPGAATPGGTTSTSATSSTSSTNAATTNTTSASSGTTSTSSFGSSSATTSSSGVSNIVLPLGVMGDSQTLHLFVSNLPREVYLSGASFSSNAAGGTPPPSSDIRRISYWLAGGEDNPGGLARQEVALATSDDALQNLPPGVDNESSFIIADEVRSLSFQYWDGTEWQDSWDSTTLGPDGVTPIGSPLAIAVTIRVAPQNTAGAPPASDEPLRTVRHILAIPSANGMTLQAAAASGTSTQSTTNASTTNASSTTNGGGVSP